MSETETKAQGQKPKTSKLAIASIISVILAFLSLALDSAFFFRGRVFSILRIAALLFFAAAVVLGVIALFVIHFSDKQLKGSRYAITVIILGATLGCLIFAGLSMTRQVERAREEHLRAKSGPEKLAELKWKDEQLITGTVRYVQVEGGFYGIVGDNGKKYDPANLPPEYAKDGLRVKFQVKEMKGMVGIHMWGEIVEVLKISKLEYQNKNNK